MLLQLLSQPRSQALSPYHSLQGTVRWETLGTRLLPGNLNSSNAGGDAGRRMWRSQVGNVYPCWFSTTENSLLAISVVCTFPLPKPTTWMDKVWPATLASPVWIIHFFLKKIAFLILIINPLSVANLVTAGYWPLCLFWRMFIRPQELGHYIPLTNRVRGPYRKLRTEFFSSSIYGPSAKRAGHK